MLGHKPGKAWPTLEVHNVVLPFLLRQAFGCGFTGKSHGDAEASKQEANLLATRVLKLKRAREVYNIYITPTPLF